MVILQRKLHVPKDPEGVQHFPGGGGGSYFFSGGSYFFANFYRNPYSLWFSRGGGGPDPYPPLDPHIQKLKNARELILKSISRG